MSVKKVMLVVFGNQIIEKTLDSRCGLVVRYGRREFYLCFTVVLQSAARVEKCAAVWRLLTYVIRIWPVGVAEFPGCHWTATTGLAFQKVILEWEAARASHNHVEGRHGDFEGEIVQEAA